MVAEDPNSDYTIKDEVKLKAIAALYGIASEGREVKELAREVAQAALLGAAGPAEVVARARLVSAGD